MQSDSGEGSSSAMLMDVDGVVDGSEENESGPLTHEEESAIARGVSIARNGAGIPSRCPEYGYRAFPRRTCKYRCWSVQVATDGTH